MSDKETPFNYYFWLGEDGELESVTPKEFEKRRKEWEGPRPQDFKE